LKAEVAGVDLNVARAKFRAVEAIAKMLIPRKTCDEEGGVRRSNEEIQPAIAPKKKKRRAGEAKRKWNLNESLHSESRPFSVNS
jgi:hypothetical protein